MFEKMLREKKTVEAMIKLYCSSVHKSKETPCSNCKLLIEYSLKKVENCVYGARKPVCAKCKIHCYGKEMRSNIKDVMRKAGPKMILRHPFLTLLHIKDRVVFKDKLG